MAKKKALVKKKGAGAKNKSGVKKGVLLPKVAIDAMPPARQQAVFRAIEKVLREARVAGALDAIHFLTQTGPLICPNGTARRMVCRKGDNGVVRCEPECVPIPGV